MINKPHLRLSVLEGRDKLAAAHERLRGLHRQQTPGLEVSRQLTDTLDDIVASIFESALADLRSQGIEGLEREVALVAHGGYGRRDMAPHSDLDLMILHEPAATERVARLAERLLRDLCDVRIDVGQSVRTPAQACQLAREDMVIWTALAESRLLTGSASLFEQFRIAFNQMSRRQRWQLLPLIEQARREERSQYGDTVFLLEPNLKRSSGGLRDWQWARWIGFARWERAAADDLRQAGHLAADDVQRLARAQEFLVRVRHELHFHANKPADVLDRAEQVRVAEAFGYRGGEGLLPVEQFMRDYFLHTTDISRIVTRLWDNARVRTRWREYLRPLTAHQVERDYYASNTEIEATARGAQKLRGNLVEVLRLCDLANLYDTRIALRTRELVRAAAGEIGEDLSPEAAARFLSLLRQPARLGELLRFLHEAGVLERIIPEFSYARALLQFNEYHKYTVDEHCLRAVEACVQMARDPGPLGRAYNEIKDKAPLHLALLIHDLGKGRPEDHSDVGLEIATRLAPRLGLSEHDAEAVKFLVHKHLVLAHLAFRRDTSDEQVIVRFAADVGTPELLRMLYVLTVADYQAVGPGVWNDWKGEVIFDIYRRAMWHLTGDAQASSVRLEQRRREIRAAVADVPDRGWYEQQIERLPVGYLTGAPTEAIAADLRRLHDLPDQGAAAQGRYLPASKMVEYTVGAREGLTPGVFHRLTGALTGQGLQILSADINTLAEGLILDRFVVADPDYAEAPPPTRMEAVSSALVQAITTGVGRPPTFRRVFQRSAARKAAALSYLPTRVRVDNNSSEAYTIIDVFAADKTGLLYTITRALFELGLSVSVAKIGTHLDQVVDVFYVTDRSGAKLPDDDRLGEIREQLLARIEAFERGE